MRGRVPALSEPSACPHFWQNFGATKKFGLRCKELQEGQKRMDRKLINVINATTGIIKNSSEVLRSINQTNITNRTPVAIPKTGQRRLLIAAFTLRGKKIAKLRTAKTIQVPTKIGATSCCEKAGIAYFPLSCSFTIPLALPKSIWPA